MRKLPSFAVQTSDMNIILHKTQTSANYFQSSAFLLKTRCNAIENYHFQEFIAYNCNLYGSTI